MRALFVALSATFATLLCLGAIADHVVSGTSADKPATYQDWQRRDLKKFVGLLNREYKVKGHFRTVR